MSTDLVPIVDTAEIAELPIEARGQMITQALVESKSWLAVATKGTDPTPIAEFKAWAATVAEMTKQKGLAEDIQLDALEMVRRAERGIGVAIRNGQEAGEIRRPGVHTGNQHTVGTPGINRDSNGVSPYSFASSDELTGNGAGIYHLTDGVSDEEFEEALTDSRTERNVSRANVVRKLRKSPSPDQPLSRRLEDIGALAATGASSRQIAKELGGTGERVRELAKANGIDIPADRIVGKTHTIDPERVVRETVWSLEGLRSGLELIGPEDLDGFTPEQVREWLSSLNESVRCIRRLVKELNQRV